MRDVGSGPRTLHRCVERTAGRFPRSGPHQRVLDYVGLYRFSAHESANLYEIISNRHQAPSLVITIN